MAAGGTQKRPEKSGRLRAEKFHRGKTARGAGGEALRPAGREEKAGEGGYRMEVDVFIS
jgi:hypothetical protein